MNYLIIYCHPNDKSFNRAILQQVTEELYSTGEVIDICNLYHSGFNPVLTPAELQQIQTGGTPPDISEHQQRIAEADRLVFIFPIWWVSMPALLKGYIDRVFTPGFAYRPTSEGIIPLLTDKQAILVNTMGSPYDEYKRSGMLDTIQKQFTAGIFNFCGIEIIGHMIFGNVTRATAEQRTEMLQQVKQYIHTITLTRS